MILCERLWFLLFWINHLRKPEEWPIFFSRFLSGWDGISFVIHPLWFPSTLDDSCQISLFKDQFPESVRHPPETVPQTVRDEEERSQSIYLLLNDNLKIITSFHFHISDFPDCAVVPLCIRIKRLSIFLQHHYGDLLYCWGGGGWLCFSCFPTISSRKNISRGKADKRTRRNVEDRFKPGYGRNNAYWNVSEIRVERVPSIYQVVLTQMAQIFHNPHSQFGSCFCFCDQSKNNFKQYNSEEKYAVRPTANRFGSINCSLAGGSAYQIKIGSHM